MIKSAVSHRWAGRALVLSTCLVLLTLTACVGIVDNSVTLSWDERWAANMKLTVSEQEVAMAGGEEILDRQVDAAFQQQQSTANALGIHLSQSKQSGPGKSRIYLYTAEGQGFSELSSFVFQGLAQIQKETTPDEARLSFSFSPMGSGARFYSLTLTIRGGKVTSTNADQVSGNTLTWANLIQTGYAQALVVQPVAHPAVNQRLTLFKDERWKAETRLIVGGAEYVAIGDPAAVDSQVHQAYQPTLDRARGLNLSVQESREQGADSSVSYVYTTRGKGWDTLNQYAFQGAAKIETVTGADQPTVHFVYTLADQGTHGYSLQLRGGKVIDANASEMKGGMAVWPTLVRGSTAQANIMVASLVPGITDHVIFLGSEQWEAETRWTVGAEDYATIGDEGEVERVIQSFQQPMLNQARSSGVPVQQRKERGSDGSTIYIAAVKGKGLDVLNQIVFQGAAQIQKVSGQDQPYIHFEYSPAGRAAASYNLQLKGEKVLANNANQVQQGIATWINVAEAGKVQADIIEPGGISMWVIGLLAALMVVAVGGFVLIRRQRRTAPTGFTPGEHPDS